MGSIAMSLGAPGNPVTGSQIVNTGVQATGAGVAAAASAGLLTTLGITAAAVPIIGPIVAGVTLLVSALGLGNGCGGTCTQATQVVNQIEPLMQQNVTAAQQQAQSNGGCLTQAEADQLEANFQSLWSKVLSGCGAIPAPGGTQCISDRQPGGKYDWTSYYLTPIQQIPVCANTAGLTASSTVSNAVASLPSWAVPVGLGLLALFLLSDNK